MLIIVIDWTSHSRSITLASLTLRLVRREGERVERDKSRGVEREIDIERDRERERKERQRDGEKEKE